jgi:sigma-E factor negative regulatory protein RseB
VLLPMKKLDGYRVLRPVMTPTRLDAEGWQLSRPAPGFRQVSCVKRPIEGRSDIAKTDAGPQVLQAIYSDGLTYVSVFIEPFRPDRHTRPLQTSVGPTQTLMLRQGDWWVTVLGDVPPVTLRVFADALQRSKN